MATPLQEKECTTISMVAEEWRKGQTEQFSHVHRMNGYPWRLRLYEKRKELRLEVICEKSIEADLWACRAVVTMTKPFVHSETLSFNNCASRNCLVTLFNDARKIQFRTLLTVRIETKDNGKMWRLRPYPAPYMPVDGVIVVGTRNISINRKFLASLSPFFFKLFYGNFKEKNNNVISIANVEFDEFANIISIIYGWDKALTSDNVHKMLELANRLELEIVKDKIANFLLQPSSPLSIHKRLLISDQYKLAFPMDLLLKQYSSIRVAELCKSPEFEQLSHETLGVLFNKCSSISAAEAQQKACAKPVSVQVVPAKTSSISTELGKSSWMIMPTIHRESMITMTLKKWRPNQTEQYSSVKRINGFPWRLKVYKAEEKDHIRLSLVCDKGKEADLWKCTARIWTDLYGSFTLTFASWDKCEQPISGGFFFTEAEIGMDIETDVDGGIYYRAPTLNIGEPFDGFLMIGEEKQIIEVNKKSLASQSEFFEGLFYGGFMENNMEAIRLGDVNYEDFSTMMAMLYGRSGATINDENALAILELSSRYQFKIVHDRVVNFLLSSASTTYSLIDKLLISDLYSLPFLMDGILSQFKTDTQLKKISESSEWRDLSKRTIRIMFEKFCYVPSIMS